MKTIWLRILSLLILPLVTLHLPGSKLMSGTEKTTLRHENENTKVLEAKLAELGVFKSP
ncbi:hypothetical protein [Pseudoalteromonas sp. Of11M-6]|uniref:hypothetical protein n=1 Tax=Pseudoalteromonas sp. Of11M-6 TaxID=2917754 RepID=UPI001EF55221|nr:hypothetical protein [Pseudoalteromonas sp. Of11M-6]MCG7556104.1 hypothetical protein [Pseudoalteromonas sp. Of11M-6]